MSVTPTAPGNHPPQSYTFSPQPFNQPPPRVPPPPAPVTIPYYNDWMRYASIVAVFVAAITMMHFASTVFTLTVLGRPLIFMPYIYVLTFVVGIAALMFALGGSGRRIFTFALYGGLASMVAAVALLDTQIYLYTISFYVLGLGTTMSLFNLYHGLMICAVVFAFIASFLSIFVALHLHRQNIWYQKNRCIWPIAGGNSGSAAAPPTPSPGPR